MTTNQTKNMNPWNWSPPDSYFVRWRELHTIEQKALKRVSRTRKPEHNQEWLDASQALYEWEIRHQSPVSHKIPLPK